VGYISIGCHIFYHRRTKSIYRKVLYIAGYAWTDYRANAHIAKAFKNNANFGQITGIQEKLDTTCK
jgi:hypothetical protein